MPDDVKEGDPTRPALQCIHPVASPGIVADIHLTAIPDVEPIKGVKRDRQPNSDEFQHEHKRQPSQKSHMRSISSSSAAGGGIRNQNMFNEKRADRNNA